MKFLPHLWGLFYRGNPGLLKEPQIAIVGSRNASPAGLQTAKAFARDLSLSGLTVTSGLALGIDTAAHKGALQCDGATIAVMGCGIDHVYPRSNAKLFEEICQCGIVVSEFCPRTPPKRTHFPQRNRIISGLSIATLVVEASIRSGSLITARLAAEQGRDVFAIPGSIHLPTSKGCHKLIRDGAKLIENIEDILDEFQLSPLSRALNHTPDKDLEPQFDDEGYDILIYKLIDYAPTTLDFLVEQSGLAMELVLSTLLDLELRGMVSNTPTGYQKLPH